MRSVATGERKASDLSQAHRWFVLILVSMGSSTIYAPAYLKNTFYNAQLDALAITNEQVGWLMSAFAWTAVACYLFSGLIADRVRMRTLMATGFFLTAALTYWYAMLPSYGTLVFIFIGMGVTTILLWWGCRYKLVRLVSKEDEYSRNIGISYGFYGAAGLLIGVIGTWVLAAFGDDSKGAFRTFLIVIATMIVLLGVLSVIFVPKFEGEISPSNSVSQIIREAGRAMANPVVLLTAATMFFVYFFYTCTSYTAPYMEELGAASTTTNIVSVTRTYGITLLAGPIFGMLAHKAKRSSLVIWIGCIFAAVAFSAIAILPGNSGVIVAIAALAIALGFISNGVFGIVSGQLTEGKVPLAVFGAATGVVSLFGFAPDTFSSIWLGKILDKAEAKGDPISAYAQIHWILAGVALLAAVSALALAWYVRSHKATLDVAYTEAAELAEANAKHVEAATA
jgi:MFS family permease